MHLQTQQEVKLRMTGMALQVVRSDGVLALYNGLSASLCRQVRAPARVPTPELFLPSHPEISPLAAPCLGLLWAPGSPRYLLLFQTY